MKAKELTLKVVNELEKGKFEIKDFKPHMSFESFVGCICEDAEILRPTGVISDNGEEIYEGFYVALDLIRDSFVHPMCVEWDDKESRWGLYIDGCHEFDLAEFEGNDYTIIGNKYQGITY